MAMAGLRFGYMLTHPNIAHEVKKSKLPYNVNIFTLAAAEIAADRPELFQNAIETLITERGRLAKEFESRSQIEAFPSKANFILIRTTYPSNQLFDALYKDGILVRDVSHYPMLDRTLRVSVGTADENTRLLAALDRALETLQ